jgi:hypothetical protein
MGARQKWQLIQTRLSEIGKSIASVFRHGNTVEALAVGGNHGHSQAAIMNTLRSLQGLAEANRDDFERYPELVLAYEHALNSGLFRYVPDPETCGLPDCWSTFKGLYERYPIGPILGDCEDFACEHAAYLTVKGKRGLIGLRPGRRIAHAVCAEESPSSYGKKIPEPVEVIDPSVTFGMERMRSYDDIQWLRVRKRKPAPLPAHVALRG